MLYFDPNEKVKFGKELFQKLMNLCATNPNSFIFKDFPALSGSVFRIFSYEIPSRSEFKLDGAMDSRGTMFLIDTKYNFVTLLCLPMRKFFSLGETTESQNVNISEAQRAFRKEDGSLLTSYICPIDDQLKFKSQKQPTFKEYDLVEQSLTNELKKEIRLLYTYGICVDLELTTPKNRVFLEYKDYKVHVLRARSMCNGESIDLRDKYFLQNFPAIKKALVKEVKVSQIDINNKDIEGYVIEHKNELYKVKTIPYLSMSAVINIQDRTKENEKMYAAALNECLDNIRSLYHYRKHSPNFPLDEILKRLDETEVYAKRTYLELINKIESIYEEHKHLERGDFARAIKDHKDLVSLLMEKYLGKEVDYKKAAIKIYGKHR